MIRRRATPVLALVLATSAGIALAAPPPNSRPASEIMRSVEQRPDFGHLLEFEWDDDGYWEVDYATRDGGRRKLRIDPVSGQPRGR